MCLSTVYELKDGLKNLIGENISVVRTEDGKVILTDIVGVESVVKGIIYSVDLVKSSIVIETAV